MTDTIHPATQAWLDAARERGIPAMVLQEDIGLVQFGYGANHCRALGWRTDRASAVAESVIEDRELTSELLKRARILQPAEAGLPSFRLLVTRGNVAGIASGDAVIDGLDTLCPDIITQVADAAKIAGLDLAEVIVEAQDLDRPLAPQGGGVREVRIPAGWPQPVVLTGAALDAAFPDPEACRIPIAAVTGVNGKTTVTRLLAHLLEAGHKVIGMTCTEGIYIDGRRIESGDCSGPRSARKVLQNRRVTAAVLETARGGILREGLAMDALDVAVVTNIGKGDHLGLNGVDTVDQLARIKGVLVTGVRPSGSAVLNAADPLVAAMADTCPGRVIFFACEESDPVIQRHLAGDGAALFVSEGEFVCAEGQKRTKLLAVDRIPLTHRGRIPFQIENALAAAAAAAWALGVPLEAICDGLRSFTPTLDYVPGRFNLIELKGATIVIDYGHNESALAAILDALRLFPNENRICVYSAAGDRRDQDIIRQGEMLAGEFDRVVLYEDQYVRDRQPGEICDLFRQGLDRPGVRAAEIETHDSWEAALRCEVERLQAGDLLLLQADDIDTTVDCMRRLYLDQKGIDARETTLYHALHELTSTDHPPA